MKADLLFWILMLLWALNGLWTGWSAPNRNYGVLGGTLLLFILIVLLGWHGPFGAPIK